VRSLIWGFSCHVASRAQLTALHRHAPRPCQELDDPAEARAARAARRDPLHAPDEPLALRLRHFDAPSERAPPPRPPPPSEGADSDDEDAAYYDAEADAHETRLIVRRELDSVGDAKAALGAALGIPASEVRLVLGGVALQPDEALLWDAGCRHLRLLYWQRVRAAA
jgi:hypothetical protein